MNNKILLKISLVFSLIGVIIILLIAEYTELPLTKIGELQNKKLDENVRIQGTITSVKNLPTLMILKIKDETGSISAILFKEEEIQIKKDQKVEIRGKIIEYQGEKEVDISLIKKLE